MIVFCVWEPKAQ